MRIIYTIFMKKNSMDLNGFKRINIKVLYRRLLSDGIAISPGPPRIKEMGIFYLHRGG